MIAPPPAATRAARPARARDNAVRARELLSACRFCAHECGADRRGGPAGLCHAGAEARFFGAQIEVTDELELIPTYAIALSGCDLRCAFCITGAESWNAGAGQAFDAAAIARRARAALDRGARTVMVLGGEPTVHLPAALELVSLLPAEARLVWKTNAHGGPAARELLDGIFDVWLADLKFGNDACARSLARISNYSAIARGNLLWAAGRGELIVRHLLMPGHLECCWKPAAQWLAAALPGVKTNLRGAFWPAWQSRRHPELRRAVSPAESEAAWAWARDLGLNLIP
ncbi:MAG: radical SAM protein [Verrucomicrobiota bacterium]|jgi:putative pyruvate formate lyase activating enzyme